MEFRDIGKHLPRTKWGEGWVEKRGKRRKVWVGFWYEYALIGESERRRTREKVLGTVKEIGDSRPSAMAKLREVRAELKGKGAEEAGVIRVANGGTGKRKYATLSIPENVALRVHERLGNQPFQATLAGAHPLRIIRLRDLHAGVSKKPRNVLKRNALQEHPHGECVS
jgi:hypothetical protein